MEFEEERRLSENRIKQLENDYTDTHNKLAECEIKYESLMKSEKRNEKKIKSLNKKIEKIKKKQASISPYECHHTISRDFEKEPIRILNLQNRVPPDQIVVKGYCFKSRIFKLCRMCNTLSSWSGYETKI